MEQDRVIARKKGVHEIGAWPELPQDYQNHGVSVCMYMYLNRRQLLPLEWVWYADE